MWSCSLGGGSFSIAIFSFSGARLDLASGFWFPEVFNWSLAPKFVPFLSIYVEGRLPPSGCLREFGFKSLGIWVLDGIGLLVQWLFCVKNGNLETGCKKSIEEAMLSESVIVRYLISWRASVSPFGC